MRVCTLIVVEGDGPNLVGRDWLRSFKLDWHRIQKVQVSDSLNRGLDTLLTRFVEVFEKSKSPIVPYLAKLHLKGQSKPVFCRPRSVPFALKEGIEEELDRLEKEGIVHRVMHSEWATPIVPILKPDKKVRICGHN